MNDQVATPKANWFVRVLIVLVVLAISTLAYFSFFRTSPAFQISGGLIALICIVVLLCLAEIFDSLKFGALLTLQRRVREEKSAKESFREENQTLRSQMITLFTSVQQNQVNNTFHGPPELWAKMLGVVTTKETVEGEAAEGEAVEAKIVEVVEAVVPGAAADEDLRAGMIQRLRQRRAAESHALKKKFDEWQIPDSERLFNVEFSASFRGIDPIMDRRLVFDGYVKSGNHELFIEVISSHGVSYTDKIYVMLNKIWLYRQAKQVHAELMLLTVDIENEERDYSPNGSRLADMFKPAVNNEILRFASVTVTRAEIEKELRDGRHP